MRVPTGVTAAEGDRRAQSSTSVICTSSLVGLEGNVGQTNYAGPGKGRDRECSRSRFAADMERYGVRRELRRTVREHPADHDRPRRRRGGGRRARREYAVGPDGPGNVAPLVVWLASDLSRHVTGQVFLDRAVDHPLHPWSANVTVTALPVSSTVRIAPDLSDA